MKRTISLTLVFVLMLSAFMLAACKSGDGKDALNTTNPPTATATVTASAEPTAEPETEAPTADPYPRPDPVTIEWLAGEMQRRYYVGCMNLELMDFSDIMDRNEDTDLFFWDNQLEMAWRVFGRDGNFVSVTIEEAYVKQIVDETEAEITADVYVLTRHPTYRFDDDGIGMDFQITVDKQRMVIISYSEPSGCSTRYNHWLSWLASNYRKEGLSWQEANKKAYEEIYADYADSAA